MEKAWHEGHERAQLAIKTFVHRIARRIAERCFITSPGWNYFHQRIAERIQV
ncbi:hypothetical protein ACLK1Z_17865 [Escherichia coli]